MRKISALLMAGLMLTAPLVSNAGEGGNAIVGSVIGGATGAVIGNGFGGRDGAIIGGAIGAAAGVAIATDHRRNDDYRDDDYRYLDSRRYERRDDYNRYDRYYDGRREVVVVDSPRYYYRGNEFVYGVPPRDYDRYGRGVYEGYDRRGPDVVVIQQSPGYSRHGWRHERNYCPPPRRW